MNKLQWNDQTLSVRRKKRMSQQTQQNHVTETCLSTEENEIPQVNDAKKSVNSASGKTGNIIFLLLLLTPTGWKFQSTGEILTTF